nr:DUF3800 domain-containing protein [Mycobacteroides chelonae]
MCGPYSIGARHYNATGKSRPVTDKNVYVYVDETGDRGSSAESSPVFGMAAVIVDSATAQHLQATIDQLRRDFKVPSGKVMSWKDHLGPHDRRRRAAQLLVSVPGLTVCYVWALKSALSPGSYLDDNDRFYNWVAFKTYKSSMWAARNVHGQSARVHFRFGHVRRFDHEKSRQYIEAEAAADPKVPHHLQASLRWVSADQYRESQAADLFGGFLSAAVWPKGQFQMTEPSYLHTVWPVIRKNPQQCAIPLGLFGMPDHSIITGSDWFPCKCCPRSA